jgi:mannosyl-3-phosphoglycerate phosphatase
MNTIIFTDLDGTLLNQEDYDYQPALPVIEELKYRQIPVIPVTSKTRQEVEFLRQEIGLSDPFIVENGSGIFIPQGDRRFLVSGEQQQGNYYLKLLGCNYLQAREGLSKVAVILEKPLQGFGDLTETDIERLTGLSLTEVKLAKAREFTEPFVTPAGVSTTALEEVVESLGFRVLLGDRFSHLLDAGAGKGKAVKWLMNNFIAKNTPLDEKLITIGLGNSPNDIEMLEAVDIAIVIPSRKGVHPGLANRGWQVAPLPGSAGWAKVLPKLLVRTRGA